MVLGRANLLSLCVCAITPFAHRHMLVCVCVFQFGLRFFLGFRSKIVLQGQPCDISLLQDGKPSFQTWSIDCMDLDGFVDDGGQALSLTLVT